MKDLVENLNSDQTKAAKDILQFLFSKEKELIISGSAGTGKTFLTKYVIKELLENYKSLCNVMNIPFIDYKIYLTATTNKASKVLGENCKNSTSTIYSLLNLIVTNNYDTGKQDIKENYTTNNQTIENSIIFIDECSMIDKKLYKYIETKILLNEKNNKVIYIGDENQLAPVGEPYSCIFLKNIPIVYLNQQMRNNTIPNLIKLSEQFKKTVQNGIFNPIVSDSKNIIHLSDNDFSKKLKEYFVQNKTNSKILAYTNDIVNKYNSYIRKELNYPDHFIENEIVIVNTPFSPNNVKDNKKYHYNLYAEYELAIKEILPNENITYDNDFLECYTYTTYQTNVLKIYSPIDINKYKKLLSKLAKNKEWEKYFFFKENIIDIRPSYASTVHKSQGSTYDNVFIDLNDIGKHWKNNDVARMLYVALTRAKYNVFLRGALPPKYGGNVIT